MGTTTGVPRACTGRDQPVSYVTLPLPGRGTVTHVTVNSDHVTEITITDRHRRDRRIGLLTAWFPGPYCLNVVDREIGGTTAIDFHCSGSWPTWIASVANDLNPVRKPADTSFCSFTLCVEAMCYKSGPDPLESLT